MAAFARRVAGAGPPLERWRTSGREVGLETVVARLGSAPLFGGGTLVIVSEPDRLVTDRSTGRRAAGIERLLDAVAPGNALALLDLPEPGRKPSAALAALRARYPQYRTMALEALPLVRFVPVRIVSWFAAG